VATLVGVSCNGVPSPATYHLCILSARSWPLEHSTYACCCGSAAQSHRAPSLRVRPQLRIRPCPVHLLQPVQQGCLQARSNCSRSHLQSDLSHTMGQCQGDIRAASPPRHPMHATDGTSHCQCLDGASLAECCLYDSALVAATCMPGCPELADVLPLPGLAAKMYPPVRSVCLGAGTFLTVVATLCRPYPANHFHSRFEVTNSVTCAAAGGQHGAAPGGCEGACPGGAGAAARWG
jgi:hypothetical protein